MIIFKNSILEFPVLNWQKTFRSGSKNGSLIPGQRLNVNESSAWSRWSPKVVYNLRTVGQVTLCVTLLAIAET